MRTKITITFLVSFMLIVLMLVQACESPKKSEREIKKNDVIVAIEKKVKNSILVCAHRSYHREAPENSLESIRKAIEVGIDFVEMDIRTTKDSVMVLMHDTKIDRTTTGMGEVKDYTYNELQQYNLKIGDSLVTEQKIPLVQDALKLLSKSNCIGNLDLKAVNYKQLYKMLSDMGMQHKVMSFIGKKKKVMEMIGIDSLYATLPLSNAVDDIIFYQENTLSPLQHFTDKSFTPENMRRVRETGQLIFINTLWDEDDDFKMGNNASMDSVIALRPAIIQTDYPKMLVEYLRKKGLHK